MMTKIRQAAQTLSRAQTRKAGCQQNDSGAHGQAEGVMALGAKGMQSRCHLSHHKLKLGRQKRGGQGS